MRFSCSLDWTCKPPALARPRPDSLVVVSDLAIGELADDVEVADVAGALLDQVEQDPLKCRRYASESEATFGPRNCWW